MPSLARSEGEQCDGYRTLEQKHNAAGAVLTFLRPVLPSAEDIHEGASESHAAYSSRLNNRSKIPYANKHTASGAPPLLLLLLLLTICACRGCGLAHHDPRDLPSGTLLA